MNHLAEFGAPLQVCTIAVLVGAVYGVPAGSPSACTPSFATRRGASFAKAVHDCDDGAGALAALEEMSIDEAADLIEGTLDHWATGGAEQQQIANMLRARSSSAGTTDGVPTGSSD